jgi:hypothetical protein
MAAGAAEPHDSAWQLAGPGVEADGHLDYGINLWSALA